jgi:hypothetical protein
MRLLLVNSCTVRWENVKRNMYNLWAEQQTRAQLYGMNV